MAVTLVHDCDVERRPVPLALNGDFRDCYLDGGDKALPHDGTFVLVGVRAAGKGSSYELRGLLLYDLLKFIPASATITAAVWWFYVNATDATLTQSFRLHRIRRHDWKEDEATWLRYRDPGDCSTATGGGNDYLDDSGKSWTPNGWAGEEVEITSGTGAGQTRTIANNTTTRLTVSSNWTTNPDATSVYNIAYGWEEPGASGTVDDRDTGIVIALGAIATTGWKNHNVLALVSDAWSNQGGICAFIMERFDAFMSSQGELQFAAKNYQPYDAAKPHHLRITYTLDGRTFQVMVR